jgi:hypothetical protein
MSNKSRSRLLAGASLSVVLTTLGAQPAWASCAFGTNAVNCGTTTTGDETSDGNAPINDREYLVDTSTLDFTGRIVAGATVDGFGLAFTNTAGGHTATIVNDGIVEVDQLNTPTAGGSAALDVSGIGTTNINVFSNGDVRNLGTGGGLLVETSGTGNIQVVVAGNVTSVGDFGIMATNSGTAGNISISTAAGTAVRSGAAGITAIQLDQANAGLVSVTNNAAVASPDGAANSLEFGIVSNTLGLGAVTVVNSGTIGSDGDRASDTGINAVIANSNSIADLSISGSGAIFSAGEGIFAENSGTGATTVDYSGTVVSTGSGVLASSSGGGDVIVSLTEVNATGGTAVEALISNVAGTGAVNVTTTGAITGTTGIHTANVGSGPTTVRTTGLVTGTAGSAIVVEQTNSNSPIIFLLATDDMTVDIGAGGAIGTGADAVTVSTGGAGNITVTSLGPVTSDTDDGIATSATTGTTTININAGSVTGGEDGIDATATTGAIAVTLAGAADVTGEGTTGVGIFAETDGAKTITIGAGSDVTAGFAIRTGGAGTTTIVNSGTLTGLTNVIFADNTTDGAFTIRNLSGGTMNGTVDLTVNNDRIDNAGIWNASGDNVFNLGNDAVVNQVGGTITVAAGTRFLGLETLDNAGIFDAEFGMAFDAGTTSVFNRATFNAGGAVDFGTGADFFRNIAGATFDVLAGAQFIGLESLTNDAGATVNIATGTSFLGLVTLDNNGTFAATAGLAFDGGNTAMTNIPGGTVNLGGAIDFGAGTDSLVSSGTVNIAGGTSFLGLETLTNSGVVNALAGLTFDATSTTVTNTNVLNLGGTINLGDGNDSLLNNAIGINAQGTIDFGAGADSFVNNSQLFLTGNLTLAGLETFTTGNASRINLNTFNLTGSAIAFTNNGLIDANGNAGLLGFTSITNAATGTIDLAAGTLSVGAGPFTNNGTILADEGLSTITGQTGFTNSGTLDLQDGAIGDRLTIASNFVGSGASNLLIDVNSSVADVLVISGAASGSTVVNINLLSDVVINSGGILVVDTGTSASASTFTLGSTVGTPLIDLSLRRIGQDFFLVALPNATALDPLSLINIGQDMWQQSADIYDNYAALKRSDLKAGAKPLGIWGQAYMSRDRIGSRNDSQSVFGNDTVVNQHARTERRGIQVGVDHNFGPGVLGVTAGWQKAEAEVREAITDVDGKGYNVGAYAILGSATGLYGGLLVKYDRNTLELDNDVLDEVGRLTSRSVGVEGEFGYRIPIGSSTLDLGAGLALVRTRIEDFSLAGIDYDYRTAKTLRGRLGARFESAVGVFIDTKLYHDFRDDNDLTLISGSESDTLEANGKGTWFRGELGYGKPASSGPFGALWVNAGDVHGFGAKLGFRF